MNMQNKRSIVLIIFACLTMLSACGTTPPAPVAQAETPTEATFFDSGVFDQDLSDKLSKNPDKFVVKPSTPLNVNKLPERVDKWLSQVKQGQGNVQLKEYSPNATKDVTLLMDMAVKLFDLAQDALLYSPAKDYDAIVEFEKGSGEVKQITFYKKRP